MPKFTYLGALAQEIDKFVFETDEEARQIIEKDLGDLRIKKAMVMDQARKTIAGHHDAIVDMQVQLDKVAASIGDNSGNASKK